MSKRGSMQLLLLSLRPRARLAAKIGAGAAFLALVGLLQAGDGFKLMTRTGVAQALNQSAWETALANQPETKPWPWEAEAVASHTEVPLLGLSASVVDAGGAKLSPLPRQGQADDPATELGDVAVGDRITLTGADGSSHIYRVTGRRVVDPHLAEAEPAPAEGEVALVTCSPLDPLLAGSLRLVIQATEGVKPAPEPEPSAEQKL